MNSVIGMLTPINKIFNKGDSRTIAVKKNIAFSIFLKCISIFISLQVVPLTIGYIDPQRYGIWLTISSIVAWLSYFDLGFANGFRNNFTKARAQNNIQLMKELITTTYCSLLVVFSFLFLIGIVINKFLDWNSLLNVKLISNEEFKILFIILSFFFCIHIISGVFNMMLTADQKPALGSLVTTLGQLLAFIGIYLLTIFTQGSLNYLALVFSGVPCVVIIFISIYTFYFTKYKEVRPSFKYFRLKLTKEILSLGGKFFLIMVSMLVIFQFINIILTRVEGPYAVTQYNIVFKYFNVAYMGFIIILNPIWSATTDAYEKKDFCWISKTTKKLEKIWLLCIPILILMVLISGFVYRIWLKSAVEIPFSLSITMGIYILAQLSGNMYMYLLNGTGKVRIQLIIYLTFSIVSIPLMTYCCKELGINGILIIPTLVFVIQSIFGRIQINKITKDTAKGIWNK